MRRTPDGEKARKPYAKSIGRRVHLKPKEAVLGFCKTTGYSGPTGSGCGAPTSCTAAAS